MAKPKFKGPKDPFEKLDKDFKTNVENMSDEDIRKKISESAIYRAERVETMKADPVLKELREKLNFEAADYRDEIKGADLRIKYAMSILEARGKL